jgi:hypothetical protein
LNPQVLAKDVEHLAGDGLPVPAWLAEARQAAQQRRKGDPLSPLLMRTCDAIARGANEGKVALTYATIAQQVRCSANTIRRAVRWLEGAGLVETFNVQVRAGNGMVRGPNLYLLRAPAGGSAKAGAVPAPGALQAVRAA